MLLLLIASLTFSYCVVVPKEALQLDATGSTVDTHRPNMLPAMTDRAQIALCAQSRAGPPLAPAATASRSTTVMSRSSSAGAP